MREYFFVRPHAPDCEVYQFVIEETKRTGHKLMFKAPRGFWNLNPKAMVSTEQSAEKK